MPPAPKAVVSALTRRLQAALALIGDRSSTRLQRMWASLDAYDEDQIASLERVALPLAGSTQTASIANAVGFYAVAAGIRPPPVSARDLNVRLDLRDPFISTWSALSHGDTFEGAVAAGASRCDTVIRNLVISTVRQTGDVVATKAGLRITGWERVPNFGACPWCVSVAGRYSTAKTADFGHDRCGCTIEPIFE